MHARKSKKQMHKWIYLYFIIHLCIYKWMFRVFLFFLLFAGVIGLYYRKRGK